MANLKPFAFPAFRQFVTATSGRNMTKAAYIAIICGVAMIVVLTIDPAYAAIHYCINAVLWACLAFFFLEWVIRIRHAFDAGRRWGYVFSFRGLVDAVSALAIPLALIAGVNLKSAWLFGAFWMLKVMPGIPGLRRLRRVLVLESGPLLSVLVIFLLVLFMASVEEFVL